MKIITLLFSIFLSTKMLQAQSLIDDSIMNIRGRWTMGEKVNQSQDPGLKPGQFPLLHKKLDSIALLFKKAYPVPTGTEAKWYANFGQYRLFDNAPAAYSFWSLYKYYYYNKNYKKIILGDETGTWAYVFVNYFNWLLEYIKLDVLIEGSLQRIWKLPKQLSAEWKGLPVFEAYTHSPFAKAAVITKNGIMPWKPVSQLQYLQALRLKKEEDGRKMISGLDENIVKTRKMIEDIKNKKDIAQDMKNKMITSLQQQVDQQISSREDQIKKTSIFINKDLAIIDNYLETQTAAVLGQQAILNRFGDFIYHKKFENPSHKDATPLVYIDQGYFNKNLPPYEPQFMVLYWRWNDNAPGNYFKKQLEENFPVEKLKAMFAK